MADFRPISCCNTTYKCIAKILANRLKNVLPSIISPWQSAFIKGRSISDNILLAQELFRNYHRSSGPPRCALKVDLRKAFDSVSWNLILDCLQLFKFPPRFISWINACISTASFSVKVNGTLAGYFKSAKGLWQGDPLSPYLFVIAMEVLSLILAKETLSPMFKFHWRTKELGLTHLCFADDLLLFCNGDINSVRILKKCLDLFSDVSFLEVNDSKSNCFMSNVQEPIAVNILQSLGFQRGSLPAIFLGLPLISTKLSIADCQPLLQKIYNQIQNWTSKSLSYAGRVQLIKAVLISIQSFWAAHFILPSAVTKCLKSYLTRFLWKGNVHDKYGAKVAWDRITKPVSEGGLNIKCLVEWNSALFIHKLLHIVDHDYTSSWTKWTHTFNLKNKHFWCMRIPNDCSWSWRKILKVRPLALKYITYRIGNGMNTKLWFDPWMGKPLASDANDPIISGSGFSSSATVSSIISNSAWSLPLVNHTVMIDFRQNFDFSIPCDSNRSDQVMWESLPASGASVAVIWNSIRARATPTQWCNLVWHKLAIPRASFLLWLACSNGFRTKDILCNYGMEVDPICVLCHYAPESFQHIYFECSFSFQILFRILRHCGWRGNSREWNSLIHSLSSLPKSGLRSDTIKLGLSVVVYSIWKARNARIHGDFRWPIRTLVRDGLNNIKCKLVSSRKFQRDKHRLANLHLD